jgi:hypothetical protein
MCISFFHLFLIPTIMITSAVVIHHINKSRFHIDSKSALYHDIQIQYHTYILNWYIKTRRKMIQKKKE